MKTKFKFYFVIFYLIGFILLLSERAQGQSSTNEISQNKKNRYSSDTASFRINLGLGLLGPAYQNGLTPSYYLAGYHHIYKGFHVGFAGNYYNKTITSTNHFRAGSVEIRYCYFINKQNAIRKKHISLYGGFATSLYLFNYANVSSSTQSFFYVPVFLGMQKEFNNRIGCFFEVSYNDIGTFKFGIATTLH